jgi:hypothetical protein
LKQAKITKEAGPLVGWGNKSQYEGGTIVEKGEGWEIYHYQEGGQLCHGVHVDGGRAQELGYEAFEVSEAD